VAFTLSNAIAYVESALEAGLELDDFAAQLSFFFNAHSNLLEEIAKFRARLWARIMKDRFKATRPTRTCFVSMPRRGSDSPAAENIVRSPYSNCQRP
jgi:methylmalonyl-CoA mutase N-terminal domain/subunit